MTIHRGDGRLARVLAREPERPGPTGLLVIGAIGIGAIQLTPLVAVKFANWRLKQWREQDSVRRCFVSANRCGCLGGQGNHRFARVATDLDRMAKMRMYPHAGAINRFGSAMGNLSDANP